MASAEVSTRFFGASCKRAISEACVGAGLDGCAARAVKAEDGGRGVFGALRLDGVVAQSGNGDTAHAAGSSCTTTRDVSVRGRKLRCEPSLSDAILRLRLLVAR